MIPRNRQATILSSTENEVQVRGHGGQHSDGHSRTAIQHLVIFLTEEGREVTYSALYTGPLFSRPTMPGNGLYSVAYNEEDSTVNHFLLVGLRENTSEEVSMLSELLAGETDPMDEPISAHEWTERFTHD